MTSKSLPKLPPPLLLLLLLFIASAASSEVQQCVFSGSCFFDRNIRKAVPCVVDQPPTATFSDGLWTEFAAFCDDLAASLKDRRLCCTADQFETLKKEMKAAEALGMKRCPGCHRAFKNLMCQMTCSPGQGRFIVVNGTSNVPASSGLTVGEIVYGVDRAFADRLYATCSSARSNVVVKLTTLMCGQYGNQCNTMRFLNFLGATDPEGGYSPFKIRHILLDDKSVQITDHLKQRKTLQKQTWPLYNKCKIR